MRDGREVGAGEAEGRGVVVEIYRFIGSLRFILNDIDMAARFALAVLRKHQVTGSIDFAAHIQTRLVSESGLVVGGLVAQGRFQVDRARVNWGFGGWRAVDFILCLIQIPEQLHIIHMIFNLLLVTTLLLRFVGELRGGVKFVGVALAVDVQRAESLIKRKALMRYPLLPHHPPMPRHRHLLLRNRFNCDAVFEFQRRGVIVRSGVLGGELGWRFLTFAAGSVLVEGGRLLQIY